MIPNTFKSISLAILLCIALTFTACTASETNTLVTTLEAISIAADVGAPVVASLSPQAAGFVGLVPGVVTAALDVVNGTTPLATATTVTAQMQSVWQQGQALLPNVSGNEKTLITGLLAAVKAGLDLFQQQFAATPKTSTLIARGYAMGFVDSPDPSKAKVKAKKLSKADKASIERARKHIAALKAALAAKEAK